VISSDMGALITSREPTRIARELGSLAPALKGVNAIVFTGGAGENSSIVRERVCREAAWLGVELDTAANNASGPRISRDQSGVTAWVIPTNEELMIAQHTTGIVLGQVKAAA
jgi:acetate kinase